jgi:hypothetical protein
VSAHALLLSLVSVTTLPGSTEQTPPERGFAKLPAALGVALIDTSNEPPGLIVTAVPETVQVRLSDASIVQLMVAETAVMPFKLLTCGEP